MYRWRSLTDAQRAELLKFRQFQGLPWHSPPHYTSESGLYLMTAACFEHRPIIGHAPARMAAFEQQLLEASQAHCQQIFAWTILPNHYHILVKCDDVEALLIVLGKLHGRTSFEWNGEESCRGRKVWFSAVETGIKSERHFWASFVYVLNNAVKHRYVAKWQDWPFCNAQRFLDQNGKEEAMRLWREYPIEDYGADWDPADL